MRILLVHPSAERREALAAALREAKSWSPYSTALPAGRSLASTMTAVWDCPLDRPVSVVPTGGSWQAIFLRWRLVVMMHLLPKLWVALPASVFGRHW